MIQHKDKKTINHTDNPFIFFFKYAVILFFYFDACNTLKHWHGYHCVASPCNNTWKVSSNWRHQGFDRKYTSILSTHKLRFDHCKQSLWKTPFWVNSFRMGILLCTIRVYLMVRGLSSLVDILLRVFYMRCALDGALQLFCFAETCRPQTGQSTLTLLLKSGFCIIIDPKSNDHLSHWLGLYHIQFSSMCVLHCMSSLWESALYRGRT